MFIDAARKLAPQIQGFTIEQSRRLPLQLVDAIARAGLFRLWIPRSLGGEETDPMTLVRVVEEVSRIDGSTGWSLSGEYGVFGGYLPPETVHEICGNDPHVRTAGQLRTVGEARMVDGGYMAMPTIALFCTALAAVSLGVARHAIEILLELANTRTTP